MTPTSAPSGHVESRIDDGVATVTLTNPAKRNAMTADMWLALPPLLATLADHPNVRVLVLTGADGNFCAGADISGLAMMFEGAELTPPEQAEEALAAFPKPTIAAIRGFCIGGGVQLALACDLRMTTASANFGVTPAKLGLAYPPRTTARLVRAIGPANAKRLLFTADIVSAERACQLGLVDEPVPDERFDDELSRVIGILASRSLLSQCASKAVVDAAVHQGAEGAVTTYNEWLREIAGSDEVREGVSAFLERRRPLFTWRTPAQGALRE